MIYLLLTVACTLAFGVIFKLAALYEVDALSLVTVNYAVAFAAVVVQIVLATPGVTTLSAQLALLGGATGLLFIGGFLLLAIATRTAGMSLALSAMRISVVIPFTYSWVFWGEVPTNMQRMGMVLACVAVVMITRRGDPGTIDRSADTPDAEDKLRPAPVAAISLLALFLSGGLTDVSMKTFNEVFLGSHSNAQFMALVFGTAMFVGVVVMAVKEKFRLAVLSPRLIVLGLVLGVVNIGSVEFLLQAIDQIAGTVVFPVVNIGVVAGGAVLGITVWREKLTRVNLAGIAIAAVSLLLLQF